LSEREKGAKGTLTAVVVAELSGGPQPSGLKGTAPTSNVTIVEILWQRERGVAAGLKDGDKVSDCVRERNPRKQMR